MNTLSHNEFSVPVPAGWADTSLVVLAGPKKGDLLTPTLTVLAKKLPRTMTAAEFASAQRESLRRTLGPEGFEFVEEGPLVGMGYDTFRFVYHFLLKEEHPRATQLQVYLIHHQTAYIITGTDLEDDFPQTRPIFDSAIRGFQVKGQPG